VSVLFLNYLGINIYYAFEVNSAKNRASINITKSTDLQQFTFNKLEFSDIKILENEMEWNGEKYDISTINIVGNNVNILCLHDTFETELIRWFENLPNKKEIQQIIYSFLISLFMIESINYRFAFLSQKNKKIIPIIKFYLAPTLTNFQPPKLHF
jgi:hypothetical protein